MSYIGRLKVSLSELDEMALFSSSRHQQPSGYLLQFRAGRMYIRDGDDSSGPVTVYPDKRKGLVYIHQADDGLMHFCWKDRTTGVVEEDLIVFPDDVEFLPVKQCTTGRVFLLKFKNSLRKQFFWMQEPKNNKDDEYCSKVNDLLNNPPAPGAARRAGGGTGGEAMDQFAVMNQLFGLGSGNSGEDRMDLHNALAGMDQQQLMQLFNLVGSGGAGSGAGAFGGALAESHQATSRTVAPPTTTSSTASTVSSNPSQSVQSSTVASTTATPSTTAPATAAPATQPGGQPVLLTDLRNVLADLASNYDASSNEAAVDLEEILSATNVEECVRKPNNESRLIRHLPDEEPIARNREELLQTIRSPQFRQAVGIFGTALQSGQLGPLMSQFDLPPNAIEACARGDIQSMAEILEREPTAAGGSQEKKEKPDNRDDKEKSSEPPPKKDKPDDEGMELD